MRQKRTVRETLRVNISGEWTEAVRVAQRCMLGVERSAKPNGLECTRYLQDVRSLERQCVRDINRLEEQKTNRN